MIVISNYIFLLLNCLYEIYNTVITTKEEEEVNDTIYIYIVFVDAAMQMCAKLVNHRIIYILNTRI